jgi:FkbM family methyltransferase
MLLHKKNQLYQSADDLSEGESFEDRITRLSPSQLGQDLWVLDKFAYKRGGFFIEFGATDGIMLSNTYLLEKEFGWHGLLAEPNPVFYEKLKINRTSLCSDACISKNTGEKVEFVLADEFGGIGEFALAGKHKDKVNSYKEYDNVIEVMTISLEDFLIQNDAPSYIEYLSVDTEGSEYSILKDFPFDKWNIQLITVEHNFEPQRELIFQLLSAYGYKRIESKWDDWYYKEQEYRDI